MKIKMIILLFMLLISFYVVSAYSVDWINPEGKSADELISSGETNYIISSGPANPQEARKLQENKTPVLSPIPGKLATGSAMNPKVSRAMAESEAATSATKTTSATTTPTTTSTSSPAGVAGSWSFELSDNAPREAILTLFQSGDAVFGTGSMKEGNNTLLIAASGSVEGNMLNLDLTSVGTVSLYRLALNANGDSASGDYKGFTASGESWTGSAKGLRSVPQSS